MNGRAFIGGLGAAVCLLALPLSGGDALKEGFLHPPNRAKSDVWWHWINGNVTKEGITADLEAMKAAGLGGAHIFDVDYFAAGPVAFNTPAWDDCILHAHREALRLGLRLTLANCSGFSSSGGPWVKPEDSMKFLVWTEMPAKGGQAFSGVLPAPPNPHGYYRDVAVIAVKDPAGLRRGLVEGKGRAKMEERKSEVVWTFDFDAPWRAREVTYRVDGPVTWFAQVDVKVEASDDGASWRVIRALRDALCFQGEKTELPREVTFDETSARHYRVTFAYAQHYPKYRFLDADVGSFARLGRLADRTVRIGRWKNGIPPAKLKPEDVVAEKDVVMLTDRMSADGRLRWRPPSAGNWTIYRLGEAANGFTCLPATKPGVGLEIDKFSRRALKQHFDAYIGRLARLAGIDPKSDPWNRSGIVGVLVDSYEAGGQNWGEGLPEAHLKRTGRPLVGKYLAAFCGRVIGSVEATEKYLADYRETVAELFASNYADALAEECEKAGLLLTLEPYGDQPCSSMRYGRKAHIPMAEFWATPHFNPKLKEAYEPSRVASVARVARAHGCKIFGSEAFTTSPAARMHWAQTPYDYKAQGDVVHAMGVNRMVYHRFAHQPWTKPTRYPGMTMGPWGTQFERTQTWWPYVGAWLEYQTRTQYLLQEGTFVASTFDAVKDDFRCDERDIRQQHRRYDDGTEGWFVACSRKTASQVTCSFAITGRTPEIWNAENGEIRKARVWREAEGRTEVTLDFPPSGAYFVMFRTKDGTGAAAAEPVYRETASAEVTSPWKVSFPFDWHTPHPRPGVRTFAHLTDWTASDEEDIRCFSGTAVYEATVSLPRAAKASDARTVLDLGEVRDLAEVEVNGVTFPVLWRPPFRVDVTKAVRGRESAKLVVRVTNPWRNRLVGDAKKPDDAPGCFGGKNRAHLRKWPDFILRGGDSPTGRGTFTTLRYWTKDDDLQPAGLLGPVRLVTERPRHILLRDFRTVKDGRVVCFNIGTAAHGPATLAVLEKHLPGVRLSVWADAPLAPELQRLMDRRFPHVKVYAGSAVPDTDAELLLVSSGASVAGSVQRSIGPWRERTGRPVAAYAIGYAPAQKSILKDLSFCFFRDRLALAKATAKDAVPVVTGFAPDAVFDFDASDEAGAEAFLKTHGLERGKFVCAIPGERSTARWTYFGGKPDKGKAAMNAAHERTDNAIVCAAIVEAVRRHGMKALLCAEQRSEMPLVTRALLAQLPDDVKAQCVVLKDFWSPDVALGVYRRCRCVFGIEMHSQVMAIGNGVPAVVMRHGGFGTKSDMMRDVGLGDWLLDIDDPDAARRAAESVGGILADPDAARAKVRAARRFIDAAASEALGRAFPADGVAAASGRK